MNRRLLGTLAAIGGVAWIAGVALALALPTDEYGDHDHPIAVTALVIGASLMAFVLGDLGTSSRTPSPTGRAVWVLGTVLGLTLVMGWPLFMVGIVGYPILVIAAAVRVHRTGRLPGSVTTIAAAASALSLIGAFTLPELVGSGSGFALWALVGVAGLAIAVAMLVPRAAAVTSI